MDRFEKIKMLFSLLRELMDYDIENTYTYNVDFTGIYREFCYIKNVLSSEKIDK